MLTKSDLDKIGSLVDTKLENKLDPIRKELSNVGHLIDIKLKPIKKDLHYLKRTADVIIKRFDEADVKLQKRVKRIENHLGLTE